MLAAGGLLASARYGWVRLSSPEELTPRRITASPPEDPVQRASISPDGNYLSYQDLAGIHIRHIDRGETWSIPPPRGACFR